MICLEYFQISKVKDTPIKFTETELRAAAVVFQENEL